MVHTCKSKVASYQLRFLTDQETWLRPLEGRYNLAYNCKTMLSCIKPPSNRHADKWTSNLLPFLI